MSHDTIEYLSLDRLSALTEAALDAAKAAGADNADAVALARFSVSSTVRNGVTEEVESAEEADLGLRVFVGDRAAMVGVNPSGDIKSVAERAVAMAKAAPADDTVALADPAALARDIDAASLEIDDGIVLTSEALTERAHRLEHAMKHVPGVTNSAGTSASAARAARWYAATNGFSAGYFTTTHSHVARAIAGDGTRMERDHWHSAKRHLADLVDEKTVGETAGRRAVRRMEAEPISTRVATVIFEPTIATGFVGHLLGAVNGSAVAREASLLAGKLGEKVLADGITIRDDPRVVRGLASRPFDGEGLASEAIDIVADGILDHYVLDLSTARRLGMTGNGRGFRGTGAPSPMATNVSVLGGAGDMASLMKEAGSGLLVTELIGSGANIVSGAYSRGAAGFWFENGEIVAPVAEITIAGNLRDMFARARFGDDAPGLYSTNAPSIAIEGLTIGGR
ncbi:metallopeptidase TldD-related protein [Acuticoccus sp. M5D2P5]|uniref:TldD/PmbA family protein n=1 Tax=Acuticoccus kalidii TaxID=2910977 RepID=UPI001F47F958|nr:metallopeptidase TldD-related protein [Acuticoccus kalidii]MCF3933464.1 metallopeptidase TldD-related protein [Acuticoccus kalidii]